MKGLGSVVLGVLVLLAFAGRRAAKGGGGGGGGRMTKADLVQLAREVGFPDPNMAAAVAMAESAGNPDALNVTPRERSVGLWQINVRVHKEVSEEALRSPLTNAAVAFGIFTKAKGWRPWGAYTDGRYKQFL
jgi:hypothetical protein